MIWYEMRWDEMRQDEIIKYYKCNKLPENVIPKSATITRYHSSSRSSGHVVPCEADLKPPIGATKNWNDRCGGPLTVMQLRRPCRSKEHHHWTVTKHGSQLELYLAKRFWPTSKSEDCQICWKTGKKCSNIDDCTSCICIVLHIVAHLTSNKKTWFRRWTSKATVFKRRWQSSLSPPDAERPLRSERER